jgi:tetratricopeptide (TPR) repeat protein
MMTMLRCDARSLVLVVAIGLASRAAWSQPASDPAEVAYEEGRRLYDLREWDQAIAKFKEAYRLKPDAKSLFNIAQAFRLKNDCNEAINFYRTYKRNFPNEKNVSKVDKFITELEPCAKEQAGKPLPKPDPVKPDPVKPKPDPVKPVKLEPVKPQPNPEPIKSNPVEPTPTFTQPQPPVENPKPSVPGRTQRIVGLAIAGVGAGAMIYGVTFALDARSLSQQAENGGLVWDPSIQIRGRDADSNAKLLMGIGGAAIAGGIVIYLVAPRTEKVQQVGVVPRDGGAMLVWTGKL